MKILVQIIDALFPPRPTQLQVRSMTDVDIKSLYQVEHTKKSLSLSLYQEPRIKALITENKFFGSSQAQKHLATLLTLWLCSQSKPLVLIPIPLSAKRERERGYNQVTVILSLISLPHVTIDASVLKRTKHTTAQTSLQRTDRLKNLTGAFTCDREKIQSYEHCTLVIVDDVLTTGATMEAAQSALSLYVHPTTTILCLALAH